MQASAKAVPSRQAAGDQAASSVSIGMEAKKRAAARARKAGLLVDAARHFCSIARPSRHDLVVFKELYYQLVDGADKSERRILSATLSRNPYTPRTILYSLALEEAGIAAPVLMFAEALNEFDIIQLTRRLSPLSLEVLCRRAVLTPLAVRALMAAGGEKCRSLIAKNPAFFNDAAIQAMLSGLELPQPLEAVLPVPDLPAIAERRPVQAVPQTAATQLLALAARSGRLGRPVPAPGTAAVFIDPARPIEPQLIRALREKDRSLLAAGLEAWCGIKRVASQAILEKGGVTERVVLFKGLGLGHLGTMQCLLQLDPALGRDVAAYSAAKASASSLDAAKCRQIVETLGARLPMPTKAPIEVAAAQTANSLQQIGVQRRRELQKPVPGAVAPSGSQPVTRRAGGLSII